MVLDADAVQDDAVKVYTDGNLKKWKSRTGLDATKGLTSDGKTKMPGNTVRIDSPEYHLGGLAAAIVALAVTLGATAIGLAWFLKSDEKPAVVKDTDTDTRSTLRPYVEP